MKKEGIHKGQTCSLCGNIYFEAPAVSRTDGKTSICPDNNPYPSTWIRIAEQERLWKTLEFQKKNRIKSYQ